MSSIAPYRFSYRGVDDRGRRHEGDIEAAGLREATAALRAKGVEPVALERPDGAAWRDDAPAADAFVRFNRNLAGMARAGIPMVEAIRRMSRMVGGRMKRDLGRVEAELREGKPLHEALGDAFPQTYRWMVRAGEAAGNLPAVLLAVARHGEIVRRARTAALNALGYPAAVAAISAAMATAFALYVLPLYRDIYAQYGFEPPAVLRTVMEWAGWPTGPMLVVASIAGVAAFAVWSRTSAAGERVLYRLPWFGRLFRLMAMVRFTGCLSVLLKARAPLPDALPPALRASGSLGWSRDAERLRARAAEGASLGDVLREAGPLGREAAGALAIAERTGRLAEGTEELSLLQMEQAVAAADGIFYVLFPAALMLIGSLAAVLIGSLIYSYFDFVAQLRP